MDIQGHEFAALQGMKEILHHNMNLQLCMEFWPYGLMQAGSDPHTFLGLLRDADFDIYLIAGHGIIPFTERLIKQKETNYYSIFVTRQPVNSCSMPS